MSDDIKAIARHAVRKIIDDLNDRSGMGIDDLDSATKREIREKWERFVHDAIIADRRQS
jgi:hypothetical protein